MNSPKLNDWLQILAAIGVISGLLFVAAEIRQNNLLARAESVRSIYYEWQNIYRFRYEHDIQVLFAKSIESPADLTDVEILKLNDYYNMMVGAYSVQTAMSERYGLAYDGEENLEWLVYLFESKFGRAWLRNNEYNVAFESDDIFDLVVNELEQRPIQTQAELLNNLKSQLSEPAE